MELINNTVYELVSEDLTGLGMQGSTSSVNFRKYFSAESKARLFAIEDYGKLLEFKVFTKGGKLTTGDLRYVMYTINEIIVK